MSSTTYNWFTVDDHDDLTEDGTVSVGSVGANTGRTGRSADITLTTSGGVPATIVIEQAGADETIEIDHFENSSGTELSSLPAAGGIFYMVGYSNCRYLTATETSAKALTDMNDNSGMLHQGGFTLYEDYGQGTMHLGVQAGANITPDYGAACEYMFKIPFYLNANKTADTLTAGFAMANQGSTVTDTASISQQGISV